MAKKKRKTKRTKVKTPKGTRPKAVGPKASTKSSLVAKGKTPSAKSASKSARGRASLAASPVAPPGILDQIVDLAAKSKAAAYKWSDDNGDLDKAPLAYVKGMAAVYAKVYCKLKAGDAAATEMAKKNTGVAASDALAFYDSIFSQAGLSNATSGVDTLRHLFVLLAGVGVRESSGHYCRGRYMKQDFDTADSAEAGLFQSSYDVTPYCKTILTNLFDAYTANSSGFLDIFKVGISCKPADWKNWGDPGEQGYKFQQLTKTCPAFAAEFAAVGLRNHRGTWGTINRKTVEVVPDYDSLFRDIESLMDRTPGSCASLI